MKGFVVITRSFIFFFEKGTPMRYHYEKPDIYRMNYGKLYICNHPLYNRNTLYTIDNIGLAAIQRKCQNKTT